MNKIGRDFFYHHCEILLNSGELTAGDISAIIQASRWYVIFIQAAEAVGEDDGEQETSTGYKAVTPAFGRMVQAQRWLNEFQNKFGFNLAARQKISMSEKKPEDELFD
jgi:P27 family predicted phage terminase small subunit